MQLVQLLHDMQAFSPDEYLFYLNRPKVHPYIATYGRMNGVEFKGSITCGHNPYLFARVVKSLRVEESQEGQSFKWDEIPASDYPIVEFHRESTS